MDADEPGLLLEARWTRDFERSLGAVVEILPGLARLTGTVDDRFLVLVDASGIRLGVPPADLTRGERIAWGHLGRLRDDWIRRESPDLLDVITLVLGQGGRTEVNETVLVAPVTTGVGAAELRITLVQLDGVARRAERYRPTS